MEGCQVIGTAHPQASSASWNCLRGDGTGITRGSLATPPTELLVPSKCDTHWTSSAQVNLSSQMLCHCTEREECRQFQDRLLCPTDRLITLKGPYIQQLGTSRTVCPSTCLSCWSFEVPKMKNPFSMLTDLNRWLCRAISADEHPQFP
ncbi:hypothetical protein CC2G_007249 [Coprinopsis cinerea AmutBmut pab1-1]|nr:hypothetical protein CC2G_007249 [Coprinopsis cinerea AmutBmut pab1-1]